MRHRPALGLLAALPLLLASAAPAADAPARGGTAATITSRTSLPKCRTCRLLEPPRATAPASCPTTRPPDPLFVPPAPYSPMPPSVVDDEFWYGTNELWTALDADGIWPMPKRNGVLFDKSFWWRQGYDWQTETTPRLRVTGRRLDAPVPAVTSSGATNGYGEFMGAFMLVMLELSAGAAGSSPVTTRAGACALWSGCAGSHSRQARAWTRQDVPECPLIDRALTELRP
jgi:hypothetical protein